MSEGPHRLFFPSFDDYTAVRALAGNLLSPDLREGEESRRLLDGQLIITPHAAAVEIYRQVATSEGITYVEGSSIPDDPYRGSLNEHH